MTTEVRPRREVAALASPVGSLVAGEIPTDALFPYPTFAGGEARQVRALIASLQDFAREAIDAREIEDREWIGDEVVRGLGERGLMGLGVPAEYGGEGLSLLGWAHVFEAFGELDPTLALVVGIHQAIGTRPIVMFGSDEQKERYLPDLAAARRLAAFALTEPGAGSDAAAISTRAVRNGDGSWRLDGEKRYIGNGDKGDVFVVFARCDDGGHVALIVEKGMDGFEPGPRYEMMGLRGNDVRPLRFRGVRVPPENVLGEPGDGFRIATKTLELGRLTLAAGDVGCVKRLTERIIGHLVERRQFDQPLADFEMVQQKVGWMVSRCFAIEAIAYMTAGLVDRGVSSCSVESALCKVNASDFIVGAAARAFELRGGEAFMRSEPYEKVLRDTRIFTVFEGSNDVLRAFVALRELKRLAGTLAEGAGPTTSNGYGGHADDDAGLGLLERGVERLHHVACELLTTHGFAIRERQFQQRRLATAIGEAYIQGATISRARDASDASERLVAEAACADSRRELHAALDEVEANDDERTAAVARLAFGGQGQRFVADRLADA
jgi:acyl-CoA dehydrogenase family member 9